MPQVVERTDLLFEILIAIGLVHFKIAIQACFVKFSKSRQSYRHQLNTIYLVATLLFFRKL